MPVGPPAVAAAAASSGSGFGLLPAGFDLGKLAAGLNLFGGLLDFQHGREAAAFHREFAALARRQGQLAADEALALAARTTADLGEQLDRDLGAALAASAASGVAVGVGTARATQGRIRDFARENQRRVKDQAFLHANAMLIQGEKGAAQHKMAAAGARQQGNRGLLQAGLSLATLLS